MILIILTPLHLLFTVLFLAYGCYGSINFRNPLYQLKTAIKYALFFICFAILGFSREFLFVNINNQLYAVYYHNPNLFLPHSLHFLESLDYATMYYGKYFLTIFYFLAYFSVTYFAVKIICVDKQFTRWIIYIYSLLLILSSIIMAYNYFINNQLDGDEYTLSRWLMGIAQSPLVTFFMIAASNLYNKIQK